jgi:hypothetical protein
MSGSKEVEGAFTYDGSDVHRLQVSRPIVPGGSTAVEELGVSHATIRVLLARACRRLGAARASSSSISPASNACAARPPPPRERSVR